MKTNKSYDYMSSVDRIFNNSQILGNKGNHYIKFQLEKDDFVIAQLGSLICMNSGVDKADIKYDGILKGFSKVLAGEPLFYQVFRGNSKGGGYIYLGTNFINSIMIIKINEGEVYRLSRNCFLASTGNIEISFTTQMKGIFDIGQEEGFILPTAVCKSKGYGYIWICAFGSLEKIVVPKNDFLIIDNGAFLACKNNSQFELSKLGKSLFSSFFGGEGFGMKFVGPVEIFIQTKNINNFLTDEPAVENEITDLIDDEVLEDVADMF